MSSLTYNSGKVVFIPFFSRVLISRVIAFRSHSIEAYEAIFWTLSKYHDESKKGLYIVNSRTKIEVSIFGVLNSFEISNLPRIKDNLYDEKELNAESLSRVFVPVSLVFLALTTLFKSVHESDIDDEVHNFGKTKEKYVW